MQLSTPFVLEARRMKDKTKPLQGGKIITKEEFEDLLFISTLKKWQREKAKEISIPMETATIAT